VKKFKKKRFNNIRLLILHTEQHIFVTFFIIVVFKMWGNIPFWRKRWQETVTEDGRSLLCCTCYLVHHLSFAHWCWISYSNNQERGREIIIHQALGRWMVLIHQTLVTALLLRCSMGVSIHHLPTAHLHRAQMLEIVCFDHGHLLNEHEWMLRKFVNKISAWFKYILVQTVGNGVHVALL
jgi:hypothetical protein